MANKRFFAGILVMALVFGITVIACNNGSTDSTDPALNGTWVASGVELKVDKGNFEVSGSGSPNYKGTYTTKNNSVTMTITHYWGKDLSNSFESKWYSRAELKTGGTSDAWLNEHFAPQTATYSVSGNTLTITGNPQMNGTYTKKQS